MATQGIQIIEEALGAPPITTANFSAVGIVGTAPDAKIDGKFANKAKDGIAYNQPFYITKRSDAADLGSRGTLPLALDSIFAQGNPGVVVVIVEQFTSGAELTATDLAGFTYAATASAFTGTAAQFAFSPDNDAIYFLSAIGNTDASGFNATQRGRVNQIKAGQVITVTKAATAPTTPRQYKVLADGPYTAITVDTNKSVIPVPVELTNTPDPSTPIAGTDYLFTASATDGAALTRTKAIGDGGTFTGIWAFLSAGTELGVTPRLIATPGLDNGTPGSGNTKNSLGAALETVAKKIRAIAIIDLPNKQSEVVGAAGAAAAYSSDRTLLVSPAAKMAKVADDGTEEIIDFAMSGFVAGKIAVNDSEMGFWTPVGNKSLAGVLGLAVPVDFEMDNPNSGAQLRIAAGTMTVINFGGGFRTWGDETPASDDPAYKFVNVRRIGDILAYTLQVNHLWAVSKSIGKNYLSDVAENVNAFIRKLKAQGAISGGLCYPDGEKNTPTAIANGEAYFNLEYTPVYPATSITFRVQLTNKYVTEIV